MEAELPLEDTNCRRAKQHTEIRERAGAQDPKPEEAAAGAGGARAGAGRPPKFSPIEQLAMTLVWLRTGLPFLVLAFLFDIERTLVSRYATTWLRALEVVLYDIYSDISMGSFKSYLNPTLKDKYRLIRYIIDATEIWCEVPEDIYAQRSLWSAYKHHCTIKFLVGISMTGVFNFCSEGYPGRITDANLVDMCGFLKEIKAGEGVMADRGFLIQAMLAVQGAHLHVPHKRFRNQAQFTAPQVQQTKEIANVRIHSERGMRRIKEWGICDKTMKVTRKDLWSSIFYVCTMLPNF